MVEARVLGTAFGICTACQNMATVISPLLTGYIQEETPGAQKGYFWVEIYFIIVSLIALSSMIAVWRYDKKQRENIL